MDLDDSTSIIHMDNYQAWVESRLYSHFLAADENNEIVICCILTLYLCPYMLFTEIWAGHFIPSHISAKLLRVLRQARRDVLWEDHKDALLWCTVVGGTFAQLGVTRSEYILLLHQSGYYTLPSDWKETESFLGIFSGRTKSSTHLEKHFGRHILSTNTLSSGLSYLATREIKIYIRPDKEILRENVLCSAYGK